MGSKSYYCCIITLLLLLLLPLPLLLLYFTYYHYSLYSYRLSKVEIEYILDTPFSMLSRKEVIIRKLLTKYHDDREALQKSIAAVAYAFDPHLAERIRAKNPKSYTSEEKNWSAVDRVLHPEVRILFD